MKFAGEVISLMGAYPGREWRMVHIVRHVCHGRTLDLKERRAVRKAIARAVEALIEAGSIVVRPDERKRGAPAWYAWK